VDMLAQYRRRRGEVGISINWGPWSGGGMATKEAQEMLRRMGVGTIEPEQGLIALEQALSSGEAQVTVASVDWKQFKSVYEARGKRWKLSEIAVVSGEEKEKKSKGGLREEWEKKPLIERKQELRKWVEEQVGEVLGYREGQRAEAGQGFFEQGMDSLLAVELRNRLETGLGLSLQATVAFDHPTVKKLSEYLSTEVLEWKEDRPVKPQSPVLSQIELLPDEYLDLEIRKRLERLEALIQRN
jgi:acyl carrier protein